MARLNQDLDVLELIKAVRNYGHLAKACFTRDERFLLKFSHHNFIYSSESEKNGQKNADDNLAAIFDEKASSRNFEAMTRNKAAKKKLSERLSKIDYSGIAD